MTAQDNIATQGNMATQDNMVRQGNMATQGNDAPTNRVWSIGSMTMDVTTFSDRLPRPGETLIGDHFAMVPGGKGANQAVAAARAGADTVMVGRVGDDLFADLLIENLRNEGIDDSAVSRVEQTTSGVAHIRVDGKGENDIVMVPQANKAMTPEVVEAAISSARPGDVALLQLEVPPETTVAAARLCAAREMLVVLDPAPAANLDPAVWAGVHVVTPNEHEAFLLTGIEVTDTESATRAGHWFLDQGVHHAIITMAGAGAVVVSAAGSASTEPQVQTFEPFKVTAVDTTAAGDAFAGALASGLAAKLGWNESIRRAMAAGALAVTKEGASPSLPTRAAIDELLASQN